MAYEEKTELRAEIIEWITEDYIDEGAEKVSTNTKFDQQWTAADFLKCTKDGHNALWVAAYNGQKEKYFYILKKLKEAHPSTYQTFFYEADNIGRTILHYAARVPDNYSILYSIINEARTPQAVRTNSYYHYLNQQDSETGRTALHIAAIIGSWNNMSLLLNAGASFSVLDGSDSTPFDYIKRKSPDLILSFLDFITSQYDRVLDEWRRKAERMGFNVEQTIANEVADKLKNLKADLVEELALQRQEILSVAKTEKENIEYYYKQANKFRYEMLRATSATGKSEAGNKYRKAVESYTKSVQQWNDLREDYNKRYQEFSKFFQEVDVPKKVFSIKKFWMQKNTSHEYFTKVMDHYESSFKATVKSLPDYQTQKSFIKKAKEEIKKVLHDEREKIISLLKLEQKNIVESYHIAIARHKDVRAIGLNKDHRSQAIKSYQEAFKHYYEQREKYTQKYQSLFRTYEKAYHDFQTFVGDQKPQYFFALFDKFFSKPAKEKELHESFVQQLRDLHKQLENNIVSLQTPTAEARLGM